MHRDAAVARKSVTHIHPIVEHSSDLIFVPGLHPHRVILNGGCITQTKIPRTNTSKRSTALGLRRRMMHSLTSSPATVAYFVTHSRQNGALSPWSCIFAFFSILCTLILRNHPFHPIPHVRAIKKKNNGVEKLVYSDDDDDIARACSRVHLRSSCDCMRFFSVGANFAGRLFFLTADLNFSVHHRRGLERALLPALLAGALPHRGKIVVYKTAPPPNSSDIRAWRCMQRGI